ncbi:MAG: hypothetical protein MOGDAGHF_01368 [Rhodocyclaceae bacterium]|nr:hypothetical protein [Rhodocyclaceae bacterium]
MRRLARWMTPSTVKMMPFGALSKIMRCSAKSVSSSLPARLRSSMSWWTPTTRRARPSASRSAAWPMSRIQRHSPEAWRMRYSAR